MYKLICMSFDGEYKTERAEFDSIQAAWEYSNELGSKWYFYPFHFVVTGTGKTVVDAPELLSRFNGVRVNTVVRQFESAAKMPDLQNADVETFAFAIA